MKHSLLTIIIAFAITNYSHSQVSEEWVARYNGTGIGFDYAYSLAVDGSGNVYVTGESIVTGQGSDYATIKYNSSGVQQWVQRYDGPGDSSDVANSLAVDDSGNVFVTGRSIGIGTNADYATIKYNSSGVQQWIQRYNGPINSNDFAYSLAVDGSGNVYVTGSSIGIGTSGDFATIKYNSSGVQQWVQRYNGTGNDNDFPSSLAIDNSGNVYITGVSFGSGTYDDFVTIKYNSSGVQQWIQVYNGTGNSYDYPYSLAVDGSGNVYVTGSSIGIGTSDDFATIKYNSSGVQQWVQRYYGTGNGNDYPYSLVIDDSENVYVTGRSIGIGTNADYATIKYNSSGVQQWIQRYNGTGNSTDVAFSLAVDRSGNVYVTGESVGIGTMQDYATIKYNSSGVQQWIQRYNGTGNDYDMSYSIAIDNSGNVYVTGASYGIGTNFDYATIKYSQSVGILQTSNSIPEKFSLLQNYPNPFNPVTKIRFDIKRGNRGEKQDVKLIIYDALGKEVATLVNEKLSVGSYEVEFNGSNLSSGIYFYKLEVSRANSLQTYNFTEVKKMTLLK